MASQWQGNSSNRAGEPIDVCRTCISPAAKLSAERIQLHSKTHAKRAQANTTYKSWPAKARKNGIAIRECKLLIWITYLLSCSHWVCMH